MMKRAIYRQVHTLTIFSLFVLAACGIDPYRPTAAKMSWEQAREEATRLIMNAPAIKSGREDIQVNDVKINSDGIFLLLQRKEEGGWAPPVQSTCRLAALDPYVTGTPYGIRGIDVTQVQMCNFVVYVREEEAYSFADALFSLKHQHR